jgi:hypothetical protein
MSFNTRNKRKITVGENVFYWTFKIQYAEDILRLTVITEDKTHSRLICKFNYKDFWLYFSDGLSEDERYNNELLKITNGNITPWLVRQVIDSAIKKGWKPFEKGKDFLIKETEDKIDINFWTETTAKERKSKIRNPKSKIV